MDELGCKASGLSISLLMSNSCLCPEAVDSMYRDVNDKIVEVDKE